MKASAFEKGNWLLVLENAQKPFYLFIDFVHRLEVIT